MYKFKQALILTLALLPLSACQPKTKHEITLPPFGQKIDVGAEGHVIRTFRKLIESADSATVFLSPAGEPQLKKEKIAGAELERLKKIFAHDFLEIGTRDLEFAEAFAISGVEFYKGPDKVMQILCDSEVEAVGYVPQTGNYRFVRKLKRKQIEEVYGPIFPGVTLPEKSRPYNTTPGKWAPGL